MTTKENIKLSKIAVLFGLVVLLSFGVFPIYAQENSGDKAAKDNWVLAFAEFKLDDAASLYSSYSQLLPELLSYNIGTDIGKKISLTEKKMRAILSLSQKKEKAISELRDLVLEKDKLFLLPETEKQKTKKLKDVETKIGKKQKELELLAADIKIETMKVSYSDNAAKAVVPWGDGKLFSRTEAKSLAADLNDNNICALVSGEIMDVSGYMVVRIKLQTGLSEVPELTLTEAGRYEDIDTVAQNLALQLSAQLQSLPERKIYFEVEPSDAKIFVNETEVLDFGKPLSFYANSVSVFACAEGFKTATKEFSLGKEKSYRLKIKLEKIPTVTVPLDIASDISVYSKTKELKPEATSEKSVASGKTLELPKEKDVLEFESNGIRTFVLFDAEKLKPSATFHGIGKSLNTKTVQSQIEKQRSIMYWSLGAVYLSLPATLILTGLRNDKQNAVASGRLPSTADNMRQIKNFTIASNVMIGVTSALALNYFVQVILYLVKADAALPKVLK